MPVIEIQPEPSIAIDAAISALGRGECVVLPTETVYGLAADASNGMAVAQIFEIKGRPHFNPLICHVADLAMAQIYGALGTTGEALARQFWPGPLTLVVPEQPDNAIHDLVKAGHNTIALRCPKGIARDIIASFGKPLAAPSANRSGRVSLTSAAHVLSEYVDRDLLILDGGPCSMGIESTIVKILDDRLVLLRPGGITKEALISASGLPVIAPTEGTIEAPGMMASHYSPDALLRRHVTHCPRDAALLAFGPAGEKNRTDAIHILNLSETGNLREAAANLYHHLKALDALQPAMIAVEPIPDEGIGLAINDRLKRAATPRK
jgi:L-threonylcarbamoyladenylate synthase